MSVRGVVRSWSDEEGWGGVDSAETPGGCRAHSSVVLGVAGFRTLSAGAAVELEWEAADQDGYGYRATAVWPVGREPTDTAIHVYGRRRPIAAR